MKTKLKHTKGNWSYCTGGTFDKPSIKVMTSNGNLTIATVSTEHLREAASILKETLPKGFGPNEDEANARLMSYSPNLLYVLKEAYEFISKGANLFNLKQRHDLEDKIKETYELATQIDIDKVEYEA